MSPTRWAKRPAASPGTCAASGSKSSKSSSVSSPSASASTSAGYIATDKKLRSVLAHPIGLPLAASLNGKTESGQYDFCQLYPDVDYHPHALDEIFSSAAKEWNGQREVDLTTKLLMELKKSGVAAYGEKEIRGVDANGDDRRGKIDLLLGGDTSTENPQSIITFIEIGLGNIEWWKKIDQGVTYVELLGDSQNKTFCFKKAMLLAVITVKKIGTVEERKDLKARFGVFLCTPKGSNDTSDFRMSLLWREETQTLQDASRAFGKLILATYQCEKWRDMKPKLKYSYLGPNCCRFGEMVLRSYDTRLRATQRRPLLYLAQDEAQKSVIFPSEDVAQTVLLTVPNDVTNALEFGYPLPEDFELHRRDWLWTGRGKLLVIGTRYRHGRHYAEKPTDFLPIIEHLEYLHGREYVHGDIRAFNMVLGGSTEARGDPVDAYAGIAEDTSSGGFVTIRRFLKGTFNRVFRAESTSGNDGRVGFIADNGCLLDFDFGGEQGEMTKYPHGYKQDLPDGLRRGQAGKVIQYKDDWHALGQVIFRCHDFCRPVRLRKGIRQELADRKEDVLIGLLYFPSGDSVEKDVIVKLKNFLRDAEKAGYTVQLSDRFRQCFSSVENPSTADTAMATGSPPNAK